MIIQDEIRVAKKLAEEEQRKRETQELAAAKSAIPALIQRHCNIRRR